MSETSFFSRVMNCNACVCHLCIPEHQLHMKKQSSEKWLHTHVPHSCLPLNKNKLTAEPWDSIFSVHTLQKFHRSLTHPFGNTASYMYSKPYENPQNKTALSILMACYRRNFSSHPQSVWCEQSVTASIQHIPPLAYFSTCLFSMLFTRTTSCNIIMQGS